MVERRVHDRSSLVKAVVSAAVCGAYFAAFLAFGRPLALVCAIPIPLLVTAWFWGFRGAVWQNMFLVPLVGGAYFFGRGVPEDPFLMAVALTLAMGLSLLVGAWVDHRDERRLREEGA